MHPTLSVLIWNVQYRRAASADGQALRAAIAACAADLVCITEAEADFLDWPHGIAAAADYGYANTGQRRKILLWSRHPWTAVDPLGDPDLPSGRYIAGRTQTPLGTIDVHGVCVPWSHAHVSTGRRDRRAWEDHGHYLAGLGRLLARAEPAAGTLVLGDFNQAIPRRRAPLAMFDALRASLPPGLRCLTEGPIPPLGLPSIDHLFCSGDMVLSDLRGLSNIAPDGHALSDHFGLHATLRHA